MSDFTEIWVYLSSSPLLHLTLTLIAYQIGDWHYKRSGGLAILNPVLLAVAMLVAVLLITDTDYGTYFEGAKFVHFLLGPATVALAIPLYNQLEQVKRSLPALLSSLALGSATGALAAIGIAWALGAGPTVVASIAPKSVTVAIAMGVSAEIGGLPSLTAMLVLLTGITGAMFGPALLHLLCVRDSRAKGLALGAASHGIGTARAVQIDETAGAFSGIAMGLNGLLTAAMLPLIWRWLF
jgi:predicted murein hydrolase (TIGR00659 family)